MSTDFQRTLQVALAVAITGGIAANAQTDPSATFEVISIKAHRLDDRRQQDPQFSPGYARFTSNGSALRHIIAFAYGVSNAAGRLTGGPAWIGSSGASYDIEATIPKGAVPAGMPYSAVRQELLSMVRNLLSDRLGLQIHRDVIEVPVYSVTLAKSGALLQRASIEERD